MGGKGSVGTSSGMVDVAWGNFTQQLKKYSKRKYHIFRKSPGKYQQREQDGQQFRTIDKLQLKNLICL